MPTLETLRRQVEGTEDLESIVKAMKSISAVRIRQFRSAVSSLDEYARTLELGLQATLRAQPRMELPRAREEQPEAVIVYGADQGLAGQFNSSLLEFTGQHLRPDAQPTPLLATVGTRIAEHLETGGWTVLERFPAPGSVDGIRPVVQDLLLTIDAWRRERDVGLVTLFYSRYTGGASYRPNRLQALPVDAEWLDELRVRPWDGRSLPTWRAPLDDLLPRLLREYLFIALFRGAAESLASENASRLSAMEAAESRIDERLTTLRHEHNQLRQQTITEELLEVVAGFEALEAEEEEDEDEDALLRGGSG